MPGTGTHRSRPAQKRYGPKAAEKVQRAMHEMKRGKLRSGRSGKKVNTREQAIAIGLSEARAAGARYRSLPETVTETVRRSSGNGEET